MRITLGESTAEAGGMGRDEGVPEGMVIGESGEVGVREGAGVNEGRCVGVKVG